MDSSKVIPAIRDEFENRLSLKASWGRNEVMHQFELAVATVLLQDFVDNRLPVQIPQRLQIAALAMQSVISNNDFTVGMGEPSRYEQAARHAKMYADTLLRIL
jgi:hypothetical protein